MEMLIKMQPHFKTKALSYMKSRTILVALTSIRNGFELDQIAISAYNFLLEGLSRVTKHDQCTACPTSKFYYFMIVIAFKKVLPVRPVH